MFRVGYVFLAIVVPVVFSIMASLDFSHKIVDNDRELRSSRCKIRRFLP